MTPDEAALAVLKPVVRLPPDRQIMVYDMVCRLHDMLEPDPEVLILAMRMQLAMWEQGQREVAPCSK